MTTTMTAAMMMMMMTKRKFKQYRINGEGRRYRRRARRAVKGTAQVAHWDSGRVPKRVADAMPNNKTETPARCRHAFLFSFRPPFPLIFSVFFFFIFLRDYSTRMYQEIVYFLIKYLIVCFSMLIVVHANKS